MENAAESVTDACSCNPTSDAYGVEGTITINTPATTDNYEQENFVESYGVSFLSSDNSN